MGDEARVKKLAADGKVTAALRLAKTIYSTNPTEKLKRKIRKMEDHLEMYGQGSDDDEDEMVNLGDDFFLYRKVSDRLYSYQTEGVLFLWKLYKMNKGGVIADDMGLGKTIQIIAFLAGMIDMDHIKHILIVLPLSLIPNWEKEFENWAPGIHVLQFYGTKSQREGNLNKVQRRGGVLLTTYGLVRSQTDCLTRFYGKPFKWDYVILDEAHAIKNPTKQTKSLHQIEASNRIVLTGTPVQNNLRELWSLYDFVHSGTLLGTIRTFKMEYETPIVRSREKDANIAARQMGERIAENLLKKINPYFLRRTKAQVLRDDGSAEGSGAKSKPKQITQKNDFIVWLYLTPLQEKLYTDFLQLEEVKEILMTKKSPLVQLTVMKKICDHPRLLARRACESLGFDNLDECRDFVDSEKSIVDKNLDSISSEKLLEESNKISFTLKLMMELKRTGHRCLVFSLSKKLLNILQKVLLQEGFVFLRMDGDVTHLNDRARLVDKFQNYDKYDAFLLTTKVGGVGLTLTAADRVIILDPSWNPAVDNQAVDRAFRIGQEKPVVIYRLITCSTIEEKIYRRQIFKESIIRQANKDCHDPFRYFTKEELRALFKLEDPHYSATQKQLEDMHVGQRVSDKQLDEHIAFLHSLDIFGISDHDLMFTREEAMVVDEAENSYIDAAIARAESKVQKETEYVTKIKGNSEYGHYTEFTHKQWFTGMWDSKKRQSSDTDEESFNEVTSEDDLDVSAGSAISTLLNVNAKVKLNSKEIEHKPKFESGLRFAAARSVNNGEVVLASDSEEEANTSLPNFEEITIGDSTEDLFAASTSDASKSEKRLSCASFIHKLRSLTASPPNEAEDYWPVVDSENPTEEVAEYCPIEVSDDDDDDSLPEVL